MNIDIISDESLIVDADEKTRAMFMLSPFVRQLPTKDFVALIRLVNQDPDPRKKISRIYAARSADGLRFELSHRAAIAPDRLPDDSNGCEDPTIEYVDGTYSVYYTGWNESLNVGQLLLAKGPNLMELHKEGIVLPSTAARLNPKEAEVVQLSPNSWFLFYEYAKDGASRIGTARSASVDGPWEVGEDLFEARPDNWDAWHLSPGPVIDEMGERPTMLYNGATRDAVWRIGWVTFDKGLTKVVDRCDGPLIRPEQIQDGYNDIAFSASSVQFEDQIWLYYTVSDAFMHRAVLKLSKLGY